MKEDDDKRLCLAEQYKDKIPVAWIVVQIIDKYRTDTGANFPGGIRLRVDDVGKDEVF